MGGACNGKHTHAHTHSVTRDTQDEKSLVQGSDAILTHVSVAPPLIEIVGYAHREDAVGDGGAGNAKHTHTHTHTHAHSVPRDTQGGWSFGQGTDAIHFSVALPLVELMGSEHREDAVGGGEAGNGKHTQTHTHTQCPL